MTKASDDKPVRRVTTPNRYGEVFVVELYNSRIVVRPKGARRGGPAEVEMSPSLFYQRLMAPRAKKGR
jgi:hypothetical protein